jgi:hypothetical protein
MEYFFAYPACHSDKLDSPLTALITITILRPEPIEINSLSGLDTFRHQDDFGVQFWRRDA